MYKKLFFSAVLFLSISTFSMAQTNSTIVNLGSKINTKYEEGHPVISAAGNELYFWRSIFRQSAGKEVQSLWYSKKDSTGQWSYAKYMSVPFNTGLTSSSVFNISTDNNAILIRGFFKNGERQGNGFSLVERGLNGWMEPRGVVVSGYTDMVQGNYSGGFITPDGKQMVLYFSEVANSSAEDLYISFRQNDGSFSRPVYISALNRPATSETTPFVAADNKTLYFASDRPGGFGDLDIWKTTRLDDTWMNWSEPVNLGPSINTAGWDAYFFLDASGEWAYMVNEVTNNLGKTDVVKIKLEKEIKPQPVVLIKGRVLNKATNAPIQAVISYEDLSNGKNEGIAISDPLLGGYQIALPYGKNYGYNASADGFMPVSENIDLSQVSEYKEITQDLYLLPIEKGQVVRINNVFFEFAKSELKLESFPELNRLVELMQKNPNMKIELGGHTDNVGSEDFNLKLSTDRTLSIQTYLISKGIAANRIKAKGYGKSKPETDNDTEEHRALNRRVEFTILEI